MKRVAALFFAIVFLPLFLMGQTAPSFGIYGGGSIPLGDFAETDLENEQSGYAKTGFLVGGEFILPITAMDGLGWVTSLNLSMHGAEADLGSFGGTLTDVEVGSWMLITPVTGLRLTTPLGGGTNVYAQGQVGLLYGRTPKVDGSFSLFGVTQDVTVDPESAMAFGYAFGAGMHLQEMFHVGIRIMGGSPEYSVQIDDPFTGTTTELEQKFPVSTFQILGGVTF
jgi:hypothetical protein